MNQTTRSFVSCATRPALASLVLVACLTGCASSTDVAEPVLADELQNESELAALAGASVWLPLQKPRFTKQDCLAAGGTIVTGSTYATQCKKLGASGGVCKLTGAEACAAGLVPSACTGATMAPYATCPTTALSANPDCSADVVRACLR